VRSYYSQMTGQDPERSPSVPPLHEGYPIEVANPHDLLDELRELSHLDKFQLKAINAAHHSLPEYDPAKFIISHREGQAESAPSSDGSPYILGVTVGRLLLTRDRGEIEPPLPVIISDFDTGTKERVEGFLNDPVIDSKAVITELAPELQNRLERFFGFLEIILPEPVTDTESLADIQRGLYDYLTTVALIELPDLLKPALETPTMHAERSRYIGQRRGRLATAKSITAA
jgi:hypothetical protein